MMPSPQQQRSIEHSDRPSSSKRTRKETREGDKALEEAPQPSRPQQNKIKALQKTFAKFEEFQWENISHWDMTLYQSPLTGLFHFLKKPPFFFFTPHWL